jgi:hypothetical protein
MALLVSLAATAAGCGNSDDSSTGSARNLSCTQLCTEGQSGNCTTIKGDCASFCDALGRNAPLSKCTAQQSAYEGCLNAAATTCGASCDAQDNALSSCVGAYCASNLADADCKTLIASF